MLRGLFTNRTVVNHLAPGARAVLANSFERIHRANLVGMGVVPLRLSAGWRPETLGILPGDVIELGLDLAALAPLAGVPVTFRRANGDRLAATATALLVTTREVALVRGGGMIPTILRKALAGATAGG